MQSSLFSNRNNCHPCAVPQPSSVAKSLLMLYAGSRVSNLEAALEQEQKRHSGVRVSSGTNLQSPARLLLYLKAAPIRSSEHHCSHSLNDKSTLYLWCGHLDVAAARFNSRRDHKTCGGAALSPKAAMLVLAPGSPAVLSTQC